MTMFLCQPASSFTIFPSFPVCLQSPASSPVVANEIHRKLSVLSSIRSCKRSHDLLVVVHHLLVLPGGVRLSFLAIQHLRLWGAIMEMLYPPTVRTS